MSDIRQQLLQAGLVTPKQAHSAERPERSSSKPRPKPSRSGRGPASPEEAAQAAEVAGAARLDGYRGSKRWYYVSRAGRVPYLSVSDKAAKGLSKGELALVESSQGEAFLVDAQAAGRIDALDPEWIRCWG